MDLGHRVLKPETRADAFAMQRAVASLPWVRGTCRVLAARVPPPHRMMGNSPGEIEPGPQRTLPLA
jgi:hypothetical protein